jgi:hypothetical protein
MHFELQKTDYMRVLPLMREVLKDPMMYSVIEGNSPGRIFVDHNDKPTCAFIWTGIDFSYIVGQKNNAAFFESIHKTILEEILPALQEAGSNFISIITFTEVHRQILLKLFQDQHPLSLGVNTFAFDLESFKKIHSQSYTIPAGFAVKKMDKAILENPKNQQILEDIEWCWNSVDHFLGDGIGTCILKDGKAVSYCYSIGYGAKSHQINIVTDSNYRRKHFAHIVGACFIDLCLEKAETLFWLCDKDNYPSRRLAESLGFEYIGNIYPVDIPIQPFEFYIGLTKHFYHTLSLPKPATEFFKKAFQLKEGSKENYFQAGVVFAAAKMPDRALQYLESAISKGWDDHSALENESSFKLLHNTPQWERIMGMIRSST